MIYIMYHISIKLGAQGFLPCNNDTWWKISRSKQKRDTKLQNANRAVRRYVFKNSLSLSQEIKLWCLGAKKSPLVEGWSRACKSDIECTFPQSIGVVNFPQEWPVEYICVHVKGMSKDKKCPGFQSYFIGDLIIIDPHRWLIIVRTSLVHRIFN